MEKDMIGTICVECQAQSPNLPLYPWTAYVNSPSSIRIRNVPKKIGSWCITRVYVSVVYPDGQIKTADCVPVGGVYVGTVAGAGVSGTTENGYTVFADGTDENGASVTGYILGRGNVTILDDDGNIQPDATRYYVRMLSADTDNHFEGDLYKSNGAWYIWQNGQSWPIGDDSAKIAELSAKVQTKADLSALETKADLSALDDKRDLDDMTVKGVPNVHGSWFNVSNGTFTEKAYWYDATRWMSGDNVEIDRTLTAGVFELKVILGTWTSVGTFTLDDNYKATVTYDGVMYSIIGYVGEIVTDNALNDYATKAEVSAKADLSTLDDYAKIDELSSKADLSALGDYIPYTIDRNGNKTAVTVGIRTSEELVGQYSMSIGVLNTLTRSSTLAVGF